MILSSVAFPTIPTMKIAQDTTVLMYLKVSAILVCWEHLTVWLDTRGCLVVRSMLDSIPEKVERWFPKSLQLAADLSELSLRTNPGTSSSKETLKHKASILKSQETKLSETEIFQYFCEILLTSSPAERNNKQTQKEETNTESIQLVARHPVSHLGRVPECLYIRCQSVVTVLLWNLHYWH